MWKNITTLIPQVYALRPLNHTKRPLARAPFKKCSPRKFVKKSLKMKDS